MVENWFGVADIINALPLLYHLGDWPEASPALSYSLIPGALISLCINLLHTGISPVNPLLSDVAPLCAWWTNCHLALAAIMRCSNGGMCRRV